MSAESAAAGPRTLVRASLAWVLGSFVGLVLVVAEIIVLALTVDSIWAILLFSPRVYYDVGFVNLFGAILAAMLGRFAHFARLRLWTIGLVAMAFTVAGASALIAYTVKFGDIP